MKELFKHIKQFQTVSYVKGTHSFSSLEETMAYAETDPTVWRFIFINEEGGRVYLVR